MRKLLLLSCLFIAFFACKKDTIRTATSYGTALDSMNLSYNKTYIFYFQRTASGVTTLDSDRVVFNSNGTVTEVAKRFDSSNYTYPDSVNFPVNTSFDYGINWNQIPDALVFTFNPVRDSVRGYVFHDYLNTDVVTLYKTKSASSTIQILVTHALPDSASYVSGWVRKL